MKGVSKIVEEVLLIAIVILLIVALFFMVGNWTSKNNSQEIQGVIIDDCVYDKTDNIIRLKIRNELDKTIYNVNIQLYNNNMEKFSELLVKQIKPNEVKLLQFPINDTSKISTNIHVEFSGVNIPGRDIVCKEIVG